MIANDNEKVSGKIQDTYFALIIYSRSRCLIVMFAYRYENPSKSNQYQLEQKYKHSRDYKAYSRI